MEKCKRKIFKIIILLLMLLFLFSYLEIYATYEFDGYYVTVSGRTSQYTSLSEFLKENNIEKMDNEEFESNKKIFLAATGDQIHQSTIRDKASADLIDINRDMGDYEKKLKMLEEQFATNAVGAYGCITAADMYYGYVYGHAWIGYKKNAEEYEKNTQDGLSPAEQFDKKYEEYLKDKENGNIDVGKAQEYYNSLNTLYDKIEDPEEQNERIDKLDDVSTTFNDKDTTLEDDLKTPDSIYTYPGQSDSSSSSGTLDDMIGDADKFVSSAGDAAISATSLQDFSNKFYNIFLTVGVIVSVIVGSVLGIKFMLGGAEDKAHIKELLIPYVVGCILIFGAFAIWKIVVTILSNSFM